MEKGIKNTYLCIRFPEETGKHRFRKKLKKNQQKVARIKKVTTFAPRFNRDIKSVEIEAQKKLKKIQQKVARIKKVTTFAPRFNRDIKSVEIEVQREEKDE